MYQRRCNHSPHNSIDPTVDILIYCTALTQHFVISPNISIEEARYEIVVDKWQTEEHPQIARPNDTQQQIGYRSERKLHPPITKDLFDFIHNPKKLHF
jgi:hypothetical protein